MSCKQCIHYNEILFFLSENKDLEYVSFNLEDIQDCKDENCAVSGVCNLWISLTLVSNLRPQLGLAEAEMTIENLDEQLKIIATRLILRP